MRYVLMILLCCFSMQFNSYSKDFEKCSITNNSYETDKCLKKLKSKLMNGDLLLTIYTSDNILYKKKNIYLSICGDNINTYKYSDRNGNLYINLKSKYLTSCKAIINIDIKSEYSLCSGGNYAVANWNSLELNNNLYLKCNTSK